MFLMLAILSSRSLAIFVLASELRADESSCLFKPLMSSSSFFWASAGSSYSFLAAFLASLILASASLVLLYSLKARFMSTVPIFSMPWANAAMGRASPKARVRKKVFFINRVKQVVGNRLDCKRQYLLKIGSQI